jgi:hypothetical protein
MASKRVNLAEVPKPTLGALGVRLASCGFETGGQVEDREPAVHAFDEEALRKNDDVAIVESKERVSTQDVERPLSAELGRDVQDERAELVSRSGDEPQAAIDDVPRDVERVNRYGRDCVGGMRLAMCPDRDGHGREVILVNARRLTKRGVQVHRAGFRVVVAGEADPPLVVMGDRSRHVLSVSKVVACDDLSEESRMRIPGEHLLLFVDA